MSGEIATLPTLVNAMQLQPGVDYIRLMGDDPYRFIPVADAPIGTVGEHVRAIGPGEWHCGPLVVVRPQGADAPPPAQPLPAAEPAPRFEDDSLAAAIIKLLDARSGPGHRAAALRDMLRTAANIALDLQLPLHHFSTCAEVAFGEMQRKRGQ